MSYDTKVVDAHGTAVAVGILLTRLSAPERETEPSRRVKRSPDASAPRRSVSTGAFKGEAALPEGYSYRRIDCDGFIMGRFESAQGPAIEFRTAMATNAGSEPYPTPGRRGWEEWTTLLGRRLVVRGDKEGGVGAHFDPPYESTHVASVGVFSSRSQTPPATLAAIFAALTYVPPRG